MNMSKIVGAVNSVIDLIQTFLPKIGIDDSSTISKVIDTVQEIAPLVAAGGEDAYTGVKNIIATIGDHPATTEEQLAALDAFSAKVDADWESKRAQFDPDAQPTGG